MRLTCNLLALVAITIQSVGAGRTLLGACPHATSAKYTCRAGSVAPFIVCLNLCPSSTPDPCAPCGNPAVTCSEVQAQKSGSSPIPFTAELKEYQYGDVCLTPVPPPGQIARENDSSGLPGGSDAVASGPAPVYAGIAPSPARPPSGR
ncbi:g3217 [Coccomyxa elongata]